MHLKTLFSTLCSLDVRVFANFLTVGDFNVDVSNHNHPLFSRLFSVTSSFALYQVVKSPTHYNPSGNHSTIDLAFVSSPFVLNFVPQFLHCHLKIIRVLFSLSVQML